MTKLVRVHEQLYVAEAGAVEVGGGREKALCFIPSTPSQAPDLDLDKSFGHDGSVAVVSAPQGSSWKSDKLFVNQITGTAGCVFALVRFDKFLKSTVDAKLVATVSGAKWVAAVKCRLRAEFGDVGATIPSGATLSLQKGATGIQVDVPSGLAIDLEECFSMYGALTPRTKQAILGLQPNDPGRLEFQFDIAVSSYNKDQPMLGLQYFRAVQEPISNTFEFNRFHYPLFSLAPGGAGTSVRLSVTLDLREPSPGNVAGAMFRSIVRVQEVIRRGVLLADVPLNKFAPGGARLFATASSVKNNLSFHFATAPTMIETPTSQPTYKGVVLLPHGSLDLTSSSGAILGSSLLERVSVFDRLKFDLKDPADAMDARLWSSTHEPLGKTADTEKRPEAYLSMYAITSAAWYDLSSGTTPDIKFSPDCLALYSLDSDAGAYRAIKCRMPTRLPISPIDFGEPAKTNRARTEFDTTVIAKHRAGLLGAETIARASSRQVFAGDHQVESSSTPQGFKVTGKEGAWSEVEFARGTGWRIVLGFGSDPAVAAKLQRAFLEKEIFIVVRRLPATPVGTLQPPTFALKFIASEWEFSTSIIGTDAVAAASSEDTAPLVIIKFGARSVVDQVNDTERWTSGETFVGDLADIAAVKARLKVVIDELVQDHKDELEKEHQANKISANTFAGPFVNTDSRWPTGKLFDPNWNGIVVLSLPMPVSSTKSPFPADLRPILDAFKSDLRAAIVCADLRPARTASNEVSQVLGLIRYSNPKEPTINYGSDPDCAGGFDLKQLKVRLRAALVEKFECRLSLGLNTFFGQEFGKAGILVGAYDRRLEAGVNRPGFRGGSLI